MDITTRLALQSQATRLTGRVPGGGDRTGRGYDPLRLAVSTTNYTRCPVRNQTQTTIRRPKGADFHIELIPLHSPLLGESLLVSFPPLSNMFKFSGSSYLSPALKHRLDKPRSQKHDAPWCLTTSAHRLDARGAQATRFLKRCGRTATPRVGFYKAFCVWQTSLDQECSNREGQSSHLRSKI